MFLIILWLIQDFLTVLNSGGMQIPGLFILGLVYKLIASGNSDDNLRAIWAAFGGGILWDLRWVGIPGFFALGYVVVMLIVIQVWGLIPPQGKESGAGLIVFALLEASQMIPPLLPVLILGGAVGWNYFLLQQIYSLPAILITMFFYRRHVKNSSKV